MRNEWLPVCFSENLRAGDVVGLRLLGDPICLFRNQRGVAACLSDRCLSRGDPLSLGRVEGANLQSLFHGWEYDVQGRVCKIPSVGDDVCEKRALRLYAYPVVERYGRVWVWPGAKDAANDSDVPNVSALAPSKEWKLLFNQNFDIDCNPVLVMENMSDLTHFYFVHHGTIARRSDAHTVDPVLGEVALGPILGSRGAGKTAKTMRVAVPNGDTYEQAFVGPCHIYTTHVNKAGAQQMRVIFHVVPVAPNHCRVMISTLVRIGSTMQKMFRMPGMVGMFAWMSERAFHQDYVLLYEQTERARQGFNTMSSVCLPTDHVPAAAKQWWHDALAAPRLHRLEQDEHYDIKLAKFWFASWTPSAMAQSMAKPDAVEEEKCADDDETALVPADDSRYVAPKQRGVRRLAYTKFRLARMQ